MAFLKNVGNSLHKLPDLVFKRSLKVGSSLLLNQNFCSPKNIRMFLRTVREPSQFGRALDTGWWL